MMNDLIWSRYTESEHEKISANLQKLLNENFIVRNKDEASRSIYTDITGNLPAYETVLEWLGFKLVVDTKLGVVGYKNQLAKSPARLSFSLYENMLLLCLSSLYYERISEVTLYRTVIVSHTELAAEIEKRSIKAESKTKFDDAMKRFRQFNLVEVIGNTDDNINQYELFNSIQLLVSQDYLSELLGILEQNKGAGSGEEVV